MTLDAKRFALAAAIVTASLWLVCSAAVSMASGRLSTTVALSMMHAQRGEFAWHFSWGGVLIGLVAWTIWAAAAAWLLAWTYNRLAGTLSS